MMPVIVWGATGQSMVVREALSATALVVALFDVRDIPSPFADVAIHQGEAGFIRWEREYRGERPVHACVAIGGDRGRDRLDRLNWLDDRGFPPITVVHPRAFIAEGVALGRGCQLLAMCAVCTGTRLGDAVIVNTGATVDHGCTVGDGVHIAPGATLTGEIVVEDFAFIGAGATVLPHIRIGAGATVGAGSVVTADVAAGDIVVGNPARSFKKEG